MLGQAPPVPRGLASSLPLQARAGVLPGGGQVGQPTGLGRLDPRNMITATSASGASFQLPSSSAFAQSRPPAMRDNAFRSAGPSEAVDSGRPWTPKPGAEGLYEKTKATPPLYWKPVDKVAAGRRLRELERGPYIARNPGPSAGGRRPLPSSSFRDTYRP